MDQSFWNLFLHAQGASLKFLTVTSVGFLIALPLYFAVKAMISKESLSVKTVFARLSVVRTFGTTLGVD